MSCNWTQGTATRYSKLSIALHWLMVLLIVGVYACIELREFYPKGSDPREALKAWHFMLGLSVLFLAFIRIGARVMAPAPAILPAPDAKQQMISKIMHLALYALMIVLPIAGWVMLSAAGKPIPFFGLELPALIGENEALAKSIKEVHGLAGQIGYFLIGLHAVAALFHHYVVKDNTLVRMLPGKD